MCGNKCIHAHPQTSQRLLEDAAKIKCIKNTYAPCQKHNKWKLCETAVNNIIGTLVSEKNDLTRILDQSSV